MVGDISAKELGAMSESTSQTPDRRFNWATSIDAVCVLLNQSRDDAAPPTLAAINELKRIADQIQVVPPLDYKALFENAVRSIAEISVALGIPEEAASTANGNEEILAVLEELIHRVKTELPAVSEATNTTSNLRGIYGDLIKLAADLARGEGFPDWSGHQFRATTAKSDRSAMMKTLRDMDDTSRNYAVRVKGLADRISAVLSEPTRAHETTAWPTCEKCQKHMIQVAHDTWEYNCEHGSPEKASAKGKRCIACGTELEGDWSYCGRKECPVNGSRNEGQS